MPGFGPVPGPQASPLAILLAHPALLQTPVVELQPCLGEKLPDQIIGLGPGARLYLEIFRVVCPPLLAMRYPESGVP